MIFIGFRPAALALFMAIHGQAGTVPELVGEKAFYTVQRGDTLYGIARRHNLSVREIQWANSLSGSSVKPGMSLKLPTLRIPPLAPSEGIVLNIPERSVYVFREGRLVSRYPAAVGKPSSQTATGVYTLRSKAVNPTWYPPRSMVRNEGVRDEPVPPGPGNPLGDRWMGWSLPGFGFHSTSSPRSIGSAASHGCVRLYPERAREMFREVRVGMPIHALYEPVLIGKRDGVYYLSVFPDVYRTGRTSLEAVKERLAGLNLLPFVTEARLSRIVARAEGYPQPIVGEEERIEVNGQELPREIAPALVNGVWMVPARTVAEALGLRITPGDGGGIRIESDSRAVEITQGSTTARWVAGTNPGSSGQSDAAESLELPAAPVRLEGTLLAPVRLFRDIADAELEWERGKRLRLTTGRMR